MKLFSTVLRTASNYIPSGIKNSLRKQRLRNIQSWYNNKSGKTYLISYPKSGRTWLRLLIGKTISLYLNSDDINPLTLSLFSKYDSRIPKIIVTHGSTRPGVLKPDELSFDFGKYQSSKIIFLVRHPGDVVVSLYYHISKRNNEFAGSLSEFIRGRKGGIDTIITYLNAWSSKLKVDQDFLLVKYEDLHLDPLQELKKIFDFLGLENIDDEIFTSAIKFASFNNMRKIERSNKLKVTELAPTDQGDINTYKTRKGKVGGYQQELSKEDIKYLKDKIQRELSPVYGYS